MQKIECTGAQYDEMGTFLAGEFEPLLDEVMDWCRDNLAETNTPFDAELTDEYKTLSPSDFGFHNSLLRKDGRLCFIDLEYFGRDDPVKLTADFQWHPGMDLKESHKKQWLQGMFILFDQDSELSQRFRAAWPIYGLRWALIMLNEFRPDGWQKRLYAAEMLQKSRKQIQYQQLQKAAGVCRSIRDEKLECPYV